MQFSTLQEIDILFGNIDDVYELTLQLYGMVEDCLEMVGDGGDQSKGRCPQLGACFLELAMVCFVVQHTDLWEVCTYPCSMSRIIIKALLCLSNSNKMEITVFSLKICHPECRIGFA